MKYVIFEVNGLELAVVFTKLITHSEVHLWNGNPVAAGFCDVVNDKWHCYGESISLRLKSRPQDGEIVTKTMNFEDF